MSNTHKLLRFACLACFSTTAITLTVFGWQYAWAQDIAALTGQGSVLLESAAGHTAASPITQNAGAGTQLFVGALLLLAGLLLHIFTLVHKNTDRSVPVHAARRKRQRSAPATLDVYWLNMSVK